AAVSPRGVGDEARRGAVLDDRRAWPSEAVEQRAGLRGARTDHAEDLDARIAAQDGERERRVGRTAERGLADGSIEDDAVSERIQRAGLPSAAKRRR
ncbi:MAG: hypothetical protein AABZ30_08235, partial [Myxococcota bacterium]